MAVEVDLTQPLDEETIAFLRERLPLERVERMVELAGASLPADEDDGGTDTPADSEEDEEDVLGPLEAEFDPAAHTVEQVLAYLITASKEETEQVLAAERAGKARRGLLDA